jgi:3-deoxy-7-phosphoheptulonate synthase
MKNDATKEQVQAVIEEIEKMGFRGIPMPGAERTAVCIVGNKGPVDDYRLLMLDGVKEAIPVTKPFKLVSKETKPESTVIRIGDIKIGGGQIVVMAGPCAVESEKQCLTIAQSVKISGARIFRGGAFKPRTSPYSFQGLGEDGLKILAKVRQETGLLIVTEATDNASIDLVEQYADIIQIGARNMQNYSLLRRAGQASKPILLKRGLAATIDELLMSAEYIMSEGNHQIILCERGIRTFTNTTRNTLDLSAIPSIKELSHLPCGRPPGICHSSLQSRCRGWCGRPYRRSPQRPRPCPLRRRPIPLPRTIRAIDERNKTLGYSIIIGITFFPAHM